MSKPAKPRRLRIEELEPRILYSADISPGLLQAAPVASVAEHRTLDAGGEFTATAAAAHSTAAAPQAQAHEVVFVDTAVPEYQKLVDDIKANAAHTGPIDVVLIGEGSDGIAKITQTLAGMHDVSAVHIISHGADGLVQLGADTLDFDSLLKNASQIKTWGQALAPGADLLLYGCDVAEYADGKALVDALSRLTGADVAASENLTGAAAKGGDWTLEYHTGAIQTGVVLSTAEEKSYNAVLQSTAVGSETRANTTTSGTQENNTNSAPRTVAMDANGNYVVVWDGNGSGDSQGIFFQRYNAAGVAQGSETRVNSTTTGTQDAPAVAMDANGNFVIAWTDSAGNVNAQLYNSSGVAQGANFRVNSSTAHVADAPAVAMSTAGFVIGFEEDTNADGSGVGVYFQRYNSSGTAQGSNTLANQTTAGDQWMDSIAMDGSGNFVITWSNGDQGSGGAGQDIYFRRFNSSGTALSGETRVNTVTAGDQDYSSVAMNASGAFVITWTSQNGQDGSGQGVYAQRYDSTGTAQNGNFLVNTTTTNNQELGTAGIDSDGNFVVVWQSYNQDGPSNTWGVYKQEYNADGTTNGGQTRVNTSTTGDQAYPSIAMNGYGQFVVSWSGNGTQTGQSDSSGVFVQRYASALIVTTTADTVNGDTSSIANLIASPGSDGKISLREAITAVNNTASTGSPIRISFNIASSGVQTINLGSALPSISNPVIIDGTTESGYAGTPLIELNGASAGGSANGLTLNSGASGSTIAGLDIHSFGADGINFNSSSNNVISGNYLGTDPTGTIAKANLVGVFIGGSSTNNTIGGTTAAARNLISGNSVDGIQLAAAGVTNNVVEGNYIGLDVTGTVAVGNTNQGVAIFGSASDNTIGGTAAGAGNVISGNGNVGIRIDDSAETGNAIWGNSIYGNGSLGIDLNKNGVTANDAGDTDTGANNLQNFPVLTSAIPSGTQITISGTLNSHANRSYRIEFFASSAADPTGYGEGQTYLGFTTVTTDGSGNVSFSPTLTATVAGGASISATATDLTTNDTSEFAKDISVNNAPVLSGANNLTAINEDPASNPGTLVSALISGKITDADSGALSGIAVTAVDNTNGTWQYSTNGGSTWTAFGTPNDSAARLLAANANTYVRFVPSANWNGTVSGLTFRAWDQTSGSAGGTADTTTNGGCSAFSSATATASITVNSVNDAPQGTNNTVTTLEDTAYTFATSDFGFGDPNDSPANNLLAVKITTLPGAGSLKDNGVAVTAGQFVSATDISSGKLVFTPAGNANGNSYASFTFQVRDDGGTANGGVNTDPTARTMTVNVTSVDDAPQGANKTVTTAENSAYTFATADFGFSDPNDSPANNLLAVKITTVPSAGSLTDNAVAVTAGQVIAVADITGGKLKFTPGTNAWGNSYASFTFQVQDDGGTANGGVDTDPTARTMTVNVSEVDHAPQGTNNTVSTSENGVYTFATADFGFSDPNDSPANNLLAVKITTLPGAGSLTDNGVAVSAGQFITVADITGGKLKFTPGANAWGNNYASFTFQVQDDGTGGTNLDPTPRSMTVNVNEVDHAPQGANNTVSTSENGVYTFATADFGFSDPNDSPANNLLAVKITTLPGAGSLTDNGVAVSAGQFITVADITGGKLKFTPGANAWGNNYASFTFQVQDDGTGGTNLDPSARTMTVNVSEVDHAPQGANNTVTTAENSAYTFATADFGFSDPNDSPANNLLAVKITTLPGAGSLTDNGVAVSAGQFVAVADITGGKLKFTPGANAWGNNYASFSFQVQDDGTGGTNLDATPRSMTVNVSEVDHAPQGTNNTVSTAENSAYTFASADFGFSDPNDSPANNLLAVKITTLPGAGSLTDNGVAVTAGQFVAVADITGGKLKFTPGANAWGNNYASFSFQVQDDGSGGTNLDPTARSMTVNVNEVDHAPQGANNTVTAAENGAYTFASADFGFSDPNDSPANNLLAVKITTVPSAGSLTDNGVAVSAGQFVSAADITGGKLVFTPAANAWGNNYAAFTFQVQDDGSGGTNLDPSARSMSLNVTHVNVAPSGSNNTIGMLENDTYVLQAGDFGYSDNETPADSLLAVKITTLPGAGSLTDNGVAVTAGQFVSAADISAGKLVFTPMAFATGSPYASFSFQVQDSGGTANGGVDLDPTPNTLSFNVLATNTAPTLSGANNLAAINENASSNGGTLVSALIAGQVSDPDAGALQGIAVTAVDNSNGTWQYSTNGGTSWNNFGAPSTASARLLAADANTYVRFVPNADWFGSVAAGITLRAWDQTAGSAGSTADTTLNGGSTAFSAATASAGITVNYVNQAPQGSSNTVTAQENVAYTFATADFGFSDPNDSPANNLLAVKITTLPGAGSLTDNGVAVSAGQFIAVADITGGKLVFTPGANAWGNNYASFTFQVQDDGGVANGGVDTDPTARSMTVNVSEVDHAPQGANNTVTTAENGAYTFATADFGFSDPNDNPANNLLAVKITTLPGAGSLTDNGVAVSAGQFVAASDISSGKLVFTPGANSWGNNYAAFSFQVQDDGSGGTNLDPTPRSMSVNVNEVDHAPQGANNTVTTAENSAYTFATADFGFSDPNDSPANNLLAVKITTLPGAGSLTDNGVAVTAGQFVAVADITGGKLVFTPGANAWGSNYSAFSFQVQDDGTGGTNLDATPRSMTVNVNEVDHAPQGANNTVTTTENGAYTFATADFGFSDPNDSPANNLLAVKITTLPGAGSLTDNGVAVTAGQFVSATEISSGKLVFTPGANGWGNNYAAFTFQVQDDGSGGTNLDATARSMTVNVNEVDHAPQGVNNTVTTTENGAYTFATADFGFSDPNDNPANNLLAVKITALPGAGSLTDNGVAVTAGQFVSATDISSGKLVFTPGANDWGNNYAAFTFQVQDDGSGGTNLDATPRSMTVDVSEVDHAPQGTNNTVTTLENSAYTFATADFGFSDPNDNPANNLLAVKITTLPGAGSLTDNGVAVTAGQFVAATDISSGKLRFTPGANDWGNNYAAFSFQVQDDGTGGTNLDATPRGMTVNVNEVDHAPQGASNTVTTAENGAYTFAAADFGFSDPNDSPANNLLAVKITTLPGAGSLTDNGVAVTAGQLVSAIDISSGKLVFTPGATAWGANYAAFSFQVQDDGTGGTNLDPTPRSMTVDVNEVDHAPQGTSNTVTTVENSAYTFATADFGFSDPNDSPANNLLAVKITTVPGAGSLTDNGVAVSAGQFVSATDISSGKLVFTPGANAWGTNYAAFTFQVQDDGTGGTNLDPTARSMSVNVSQVNQAPQGVSNTVTTLENNAYTFASADFGFSDPSDSPSNNLLAVKITTLPGVGSLTDNGVAVVAGQFVSVTDISSGKLVFTPGAGGWGNNYAAFGFQVQDDGGILNGGLDTDPSVRTMTVNVSEVNHAPQGTSNTVTTLENSAYTFASADFGFSDPNDSPANSLLGVKITTLPGAGSLTDNGAAVGAGQLISVTDIAGGKLKFTPALNASGAAYASFGFQVQDNGGTANAGVDTDAVAKSMTVDVSFVNQPPVLSSNTLSISQGGIVALSAANLSATDVDNAASSLVFIMSNILNGHFELVTSPGVPVSTFTQADVSGGQVRFVDSGSATAPSFDVRISDGSLTVGPVVANISFSALPSPAPGPVGPIAGPTPLPISVPTPPPVQPAPLPQTPSGGGGGVGAPRPGTGPSGGRAPVAPEAVAVELTRSARGAEPLLVQQQAPRVSLNPAPNLHPQDLALLIQGSEPQSLQSGPPTKADWSAHTAFPEKGHDSEQESIEVLMESVRVSTIALSVGVVWWASRVSGLIGSLLASVPAWRHLDPMPIVGRDKEDAQDWDDPRDADADADELAISMVLEGPSAHAPTTA